MLPVGIVFELLFVALLLLWRKKRKSAAAFILLAMSVLWVSSMPVVASYLLGGLEQQYPGVPMSEVPVSECIVVLGGSLEPVLPPRVDVDLRDSADRILKAADLYKAGKAPLIIVAAGNQPWSAYGQTEAQATSELLVNWGVPATAIMSEGESRNTQENAANSKTLLDSAACQTPLLVTSAAHMARSVATFEKIGVNVFPVSADVRVGRTPYLTVFNFIPDADALETTSDAMREWMGQIVYQLRGWN